MEIIVGLFIVFYLFMLTATFINKHKMKWAEIRKKYSFTRNEIKRIESETKPGRIFYAINNDWSNTNLISVCKQQEFIYMGQRAFMRLAVSATKNTYFRYELYKN